jgi:serine/threonine-protein kinase
MGTIYLAVAGGLADFRKLLVVKELRQDLSSNRRFVEMFLDEAKLAARLNHPNVVQTIEAGQDGERYFLSMEFLDGQPYSSIWHSADQQPQVALPIRLKIISEALAGLHYAHTLTEYDGTSLHIVHRDVSPQNIFVTYDGQVKVVDFGIAKAAVSGTLTAPGMFKGKFGYAAPEQVRGEEVDARTDVFAMGVILWEALAMQRFCDGEVTRAGVATRLAGREPRASRFRPGLDPRLAAICDRALAVDSRARFATAEEFRVALDEYLEQTGQRVEAAAIKQLLTQKFAAERAAVHRLIDRHIKLGPVESSRVTPVMLGTEAGNNQPTQVADLSQYVRSATTETVVSNISVDLADQPRKRSPWLIGAGAAAAFAVLGGSFAIARMSGSQPSAAAIGAAPTAAALRPSAAKVVLPMARPPAPADAPPAQHAADSLAAASARGSVAPVQPAAPPPLTAAARPPARRVTRVRAPAVVAPAVAQAIPEPAPQPTPVHVEYAAPAPDTNVAVGADLNRVGQAYHRRSIDTEL